MSEESIQPNRSRDELFQRLNNAASQSGYHLNPDLDFTYDLLDGLLVNEERYGYPACPCRLASGTKSDDLDIVCPCDYRDADITELGACYCALYVSKDVAEGIKQPSSIPDRRMSAKNSKASPSLAETQMTPTPVLPVWRCKVCGYLCGRENPPEVCPICKAKQERFERFW